MASRFGQMDVNLNYKNNDIFNSSFHVTFLIHFVVIDDKGDPALLSARDPRTNLYHSKSQKDILRRKDDRYRDTSIRQHTWGTRESSLEDTTYFNALGKEILRTSQNMVRE